MSNEKFETLAVYPMEDIEHRTKYLFDQMIHYCKQHGCELLDLGHQLRLTIESSQFWEGSFEIRITRRYFDYRMSPICRKVMRKTKEVNDRIREIFRNDNLSFLEKKALASKNIRRMEIHYDMLCDFIDELEVLK